MGLRLKSLRLLRGDGQVEEEARLRLQVARPLIVPTLPSVHRGALGLLGEGDQRRLRSAQRLKLLVFQET